MLNTTQCFFLTNANATEKSEMWNFEKDLSLFNTSQIKALHILTHVLTCGEESAALVFTHFALTNIEDGGRALALTGIAEDEFKHEYLLRTLRNQIEASCSDISNVSDAIKSRSKRFFMKVNSTDETVNLARIAALDSCVTVILTALLHSNVLKNTFQIKKLMMEIRKDESRHVKVTRSIVNTCLNGSDILKKEKQFIKPLFINFFRHHESNLGILGVSWRRIEMHLLNEGDTYHS